MMMSMAEEKGSMLFDGNRSETAILPASRTSSMVRCDRLSRIEFAAAGSYEGA
jgi:hypothetical protein